MENHDSSVANSQTNDKLVISYEVLQLMEWMIEHEAESLKKVIVKSLKHGFDNQLKKLKNYKNLNSTEQMQNTIIDFIGLLEILFFEANNEQEANNVLQKTMMPIIDHVDTKNCDSSILKTSIAVATNKYQRNPKENVQQIFLKELLKRWKPNKNGIMN